MYFEGSRLPMVASTNWSFCVFLAQAAMTSLEPDMFAGTHLPAFTLLLLRMFCLRLNFYMHQEETCFARIDTKLDSCAKVLILSFCAKHVNNICTNNKYTCIYFNNAEQK